jgi:hypothetical protein
MAPDTELAVLKATIDAALAFAADGDREAALVCLGTGLSWAKQVCAGGTPRGTEVIRRYARRWVARRKANRGETTAREDLRPKAWPTSFWSGP